MLRKGSKIFNSVFLNNAFHHATIRRAALLSECLHGKIQEQCLLARIIFKIQELFLPVSSLYFLERSPHLLAWTTLCRASLTLHEVSFPAPDNMWYSYSRRYQRTFFVHLFLTKIGLRCIQRRYFYSFQWWNEGFEWVPLVFRLNLD